MPPVINVTGEVFDEIVDRASPGESLDAALRRLLDLDPANGKRVTRLPSKQIFIPSVTVPARFSSVDAALRFAFEMPELPSDPYSREIMTTAMSERSGFGSVTISQEVAEMLKQAARGTSQAEVVRNIFHE